MFKQCTEARFDEMLGILPPAFWTSKGFLVGEPFDHRKCKVTGHILPSYAAFICHQTNPQSFWEGPNMTIPEFQAFDVSQLCAPSK